MTSTHRNTLLAALAASAFVSAASAQFTYDFNVSQADFNSKFTTPSTNFETSWVNGTTATNGVGASGSGYLATSSSDQTAYWGSSIGQLTGSGQTVWTSTYFKAGIAASSNGSSNMRVGFQLDNTSQLGTGTYAFATVSTLANDGTNATQQALQVGYRNGGTLATNNDTNFGVLTNNNWYQLRLDLTSSSSTSISATVSLYDWGTNGVTGGTLVDSFTTSLTGSVGGNMSTMFNADLWAGFLAKSTNGSGARAFQVDNFSASAIPEPSAFAALAGLGAIGLAATRRRRRA